MKKESNFILSRPVQNSNCLAHLRCFQCGSIGPFRIEGRSMFTVFDDGTDEQDDVTWDEESYMICSACGAEATLAEFRFPYQCVSCEFGFEQVDIDNLPTKFPDIPNILERIAPGESVPYGECPECGSLIRKV